MTPTATQALKKILALRQITFETNTVTRRTQGDILQSLTDMDLTDVSTALADHKQQFGW
jgi:hypothetical protein